MRITDRAAQWVLVLAGGEGTRLQDLTREITGAPIPKQYCRLLGEHSLLEATLERARHFAPLERTAVVVNRAHLELGAPQLLQLPRENIFVQPCNRDTGPGLVYSLWCLARMVPYATVVVLPSDHYIGDDRAFARHIKRATQLVDRFPDKVVVLGIRPDYPEAGYGYLTLSHQLRGRERVFHVAGFEEKPSHKLAQRLIARGGLWNSFVMVFRLSRMLQLIQIAAPKEFARMEALQVRRRPLEDAYREMAPWNFSHLVLSRIPAHLLVLQVDDVHWSDWGTRESIERTLKTLKRLPPWRKEQDHQPRPEGQGGLDLMEQESPLEHLKVRGRARGRRDC
jgi:mannose-1-phosphate guanylyltransferase